MKPTFILDSSSFSSAESEVVSNQITRRAFLKRTGGATVAAVVAFHMIEKVRAADGSGSSDEEEEWYDMRCVAPSVTASSQEAFVVVALPLSVLNCELWLTAGKVEDPPETGYNDINFDHTFGFEASDGTSSTSISGNSNFDSSCNSETGDISTSVNSFASNPTSGNLSGTFTDGIYNYSITISIARSAGGAGATTQIFGTLSWQNITDPNDSGSATIPDEGVLSISNSFASKKHPE